MQFLSLETSTIIVIIVVVAVLAVLLIAYGIFYVTTKNSFVTLRNDMEESYSAMDVHMKKRYDLIPNLVEVCKGYAKHESETFTKIADARRVAMAAGPDDKAAAESSLTTSLHMLLNAVRENYPELKANQHYIELTRQLEQCEHEIANSRKYYNAKVKVLNVKIEKFPSSIIAKKIGLERKPYFEIEDKSERVAPKVDFSETPGRRM